MLATNAAQAPLYFFQALQEKDYPRVWELLTERSQSMIVQMLARTWKAHSAEELIENFAAGGGVAQTYWQSFAQSVKLEQWLAQSYRQLGVSGQEVIVKATPSDVHLLVYQQGGRWKFGYIETFMDFQ